MSARRSPSPTTSTIWNGSSTNEPTAAACGSRSGTASAATSCSHSPPDAPTSSSASRSTRHRCRGSTGGRPRRPVVPRSVPATRRRPARRSCGDSSATTSGSGCRRRPEPPVGPKGRPCSVSCPICGDARRGTVPTSPSRCWRMVGEHARPHHRQAVGALPSMLPDARVVEIEGAGHFGPNTHADAVSAALVSFLGRDAATDG